MNRKAQGGFTTKELVVAIVAVFVLVVVLTGVIGYLSNGISFFKWLPGFNESSGGPVTGGGESMVFRYNINDGKAEYYNGVQGIVYSDSEVIKLGEGKEIVFGQLKEDFERHYFGSSAREDGKISFPYETPLFSSDFYRGDSTFNDQSKLQIKIDAFSNPLPSMGGYIISSAKRGDILASLVSEDNSPYGRILLSASDIFSLWLFTSTGQGNVLKNAAEDLSKIEVMVLPKGVGLGVSYIPFESSEQYRIALSGIISWRDSVLSKPMLVNLEGGKKIYACVQKIKSGENYYLWSDLKEASDKLEGVKCAV